MKNVRLLGYLSLLFFFFSSELGYSQIYGYSLIDSIEESDEENNQEVINNIENILDSYFQKYYPLYGDNFMYNIAMRLDDIYQDSPSERLDSILTDVIIGFEETHYDILCIEEDDCLIDYLDNFWTTSQ